jgi:uncharacterized protein (TIGR00375 family)
VDYDGRPIFKIPCPEFVEALKSISNDIEVIPAHIWTPWFSLFGSKSGFDSIEECYGDQAKNIHAFETGLSSDPAMNWRLSQLDRFQILSFSDLHSFWPWRIGREAAIFDIEPSYKALMESIRTGNGLIGTVEVDPSYGKYHYDGHRQCNVVLSPAESMKNHNICPVCKRPLTIGVLNRVEELADRPDGFKRKNAKPYYSLIPLAELITTKLGVAENSRQMWAEYNKILAGQTEFAVMLELTEDELLKRTGPEMAELIMKNREGKIYVKPGYDGVYGEPVLGEKPVEKKVDSGWKQQKPKRTQTGLDEFL